MENQVAELNIWLETTRQDIDAECCICRIAFHAKRTCDLWVEESVGGAQWHCGAVCPSCEANNLWTDDDAVRRILDEIRARGE